MRTKYDCYPEYHTSRDDLSLISPRGLQGAYDVLQDCLTILEANRYYRTVTHCEPQLCKRGLYATLSDRTIENDSKSMLDILAYADGGSDLIALSETIGVDALYCAQLVSRLESAGLLESVDATS
jgi:aminopeptidase-like protein